MIVKITDHILYYQPLITVPPIFDVPKIAKRVYIRKDGNIKATRPLERIGAHAQGFNQNSIGICYEGGLDCKGRPADTRTPAQREHLWLLVRQILDTFPGCRVVGHRDLSPDLNKNGEIEPEEWVKACPCFEVKEEWKDVVSKLAVI